MKLIRNKNIEYYQFESFDSNLITHGVFTRKGGVSPAPWSSLNQGGTVGDLRENVVENRRRVFKVFKRPVESIFDVWQVHGTDVVCTQHARPLDVDHIKADAIVTDSPDVTLFMRFADCVPILIYDPNKKIAAIIHAGWQGTVNKIIMHTLRKLQDQYQCDPKTLISAIGPSIGVCHYQVGIEVATAVRESFGGVSETLLIQREGKIYFDLWKANETLLRTGGVSSVEIANLCTACHTDDWYSHRAEAGKTGRFCAVLFLNKEG